MSVFSVVAFIYGKTALGWLAVWFCILFSVLLVLRQVHGRGKKGLMTGKGLFRVDRRYLLLTRVVLFVLASSEFGRVDLVVITTAVSRSPFSGVADNNKFFCGWQKMGVY